MRFSFFTLFPDLIMPYFGHSIMRNAIHNKKIEVECINIRDFASNKHKKVDNALIGGGAGMLLDPFVLDCALQQARDSRIIFLSPCGARFSHKDSVRLSKYSHISFVCGRYEGFDERSIELHATEIFSIGDFILIPTRRVSPALNCGTDLFSSCAFSNCSIYRFFMISSLMMLINPV